jgi:hypothetical protein
MSRHKVIVKFGTFQNRAKVVDSLLGDTSVMAGCRHNLALRGNLSMRLRAQMERLGSFRVFVSTIVLPSVYRVDDRLP